MQAFCGIDVACAKGKRLPVAIVTRHGGGIRALPLRRGAPPPAGKGNRLALDPEWRRAFARETLGYLQSIETQYGVHIARIAIDAPRAPAVSGRRLAEQAMDRLGISCITTPTRERFELAVERARGHLAGGGSDATLPHANQIWMLVGFELFDTLGSWRPCIEVFPQATIRAIAPGTLHKSKPGGMDDQAKAIAEHACWDRTELRNAAFGARHDRLDAVMSAWIASLPEHERVGYGDGGEDTIWSVRAPALSGGASRP